MSTEYTSNLKRSPDTGFWMRISLAGFLLTALIGVLMRYKIGFEFPFFNQKYLQHAHSHFAFAGWVQQALFVLLISGLDDFRLSSSTGSFRAVLWANLLTAVGMLIAFSIQGYGFYAITFSTLSIVVFFWFSWVYIRQVRAMKSVKQHKWQIAALIFGMLSTLGTAALVYMMVSKNITQNWYLSSVYWYLHFQYNGWFFFACVGILEGFMKKSDPQRSIPSLVFWLFAAACIPAYGLSVLWLDLHIAIYLPVAASAIVQVAAFVLLLRFVLKQGTLTRSKSGLIPWALITFAAVALGVKFLLQAGSIVPAVSDLAFGFRPIVIAYLHLVLLAITSVFLIYAGFAGGSFSTSPLASVGVWILLAGIFFNEALLGVQGILSIGYNLIPHINTYLLSAALVIFAGIGVLLFSQIRFRQKD